MPKYKYFYLESQPYTNTMYSSVGFPFEDLFTCPKL